MAGCSGAKHIAAVNKDPNANIFKEASFGVVGDWKNVLPAFIEAVRELRGAESRSVSRPRASNSRPQSMEEDFVVDIEEVFNSIEQADVMSLFFPTFRKALVIDARSSDKDGPMARVMPMVGSPQERLRSIEGLRPGFPSPKNLVVIPWPRYIDSLVNLGVWERIVSRLADSGHAEVVEHGLSAVLEELRSLEKAGLAAVVLGEDYQTIWAAEE